MYRKQISVLIVVFLLILAACSKQTSDENECAREDVLCVGLVTDIGRVDDRSFNQSAWEGVQRAALELGAVVDYIETESPMDFGTNIDQFAQQQFDVIVTGGFGLDEATSNAAVKYPKVDFIAVDQFQDPGSELPNVTGLIFPEDHAGFLAGALAAMMTQSQTVAAVLGTNLVPPVVAFKEGYEAGALYINPEIRIISTYHPGGLDTAFDDPDWGAQIAEEALQQGADIIFAAGGGTGVGALRVTASQSNKFCIGVDTDQWDTVPEAHGCLISSAMKLITPGVYELVVLSQTGQFPGGNFLGEADLAPFHDFDSQIPGVVKDRLVAIKVGIQDGSISTGYSP